MSIIASRRSPYPYTFKIGNTGLMLGAPKPNAPLLTSSKAQDLSAVAPPDYSYAGASPIGDRDEPYESLVLGMGMKVQEKWQDFKYYAASGVDLSVWPWCKGPEITVVTPAAADAVNGVRTFFELGSVLFVVDGTKIARRDSDATWTTVKDFGTAVVLNATVFTSNSDGIQRVFVALTNGVAQWSSGDGSTWHPFTTFTALAFCAIGKEFWWATDTNLLRKCDTNADPTNEANYTTTQFRAGDKQAPITALMVTSAGTLLIAKTDGLYTLDATGLDHPLFPFLKFALDGSNGRNWGQFENDLYIAYGTTFQKIGADLSMEEVGPEKLVNNDSPVRGKITAFAGVGSMFAYGAVFNPDTLTGYICKFGSWVSQTSMTSSSLTSATNNLDAVHIDAWNGSVSRPFVNRAIGSLFVSKVGAPLGHTRTYIGFSDGTVGWMINACVPNPAACSAYRFVVGDDWVELPLWHGGYHASVKSLRHLSVLGTCLEPENYVTVEYKLDPDNDGAWIDFGNVFDTTSYEQAPFSTDTSGILVGFRVHLHNESNLEGPLVSAFTIGHALRPQRYMQVELDVLCADGLVRRDGVPLRIGRKQIQKVVEQAVDDPGAVTCTLPDESVQDLSFTDYAISQSFDEVGRQWRGSLSVKAIQWVAPEIKPGG